MKSPIITSFSPLLLPPCTEERVTDIRFYFVVLIDIFYYGHTFGVRVDGTSSRRFLRYLSLTAFQAEGCGIARRAMSFISRLRRSRQHRVSILSAYLVHPFPLRGTSPQGETRALRDWLFVSYGMISILVIGSLRSPPPFPLRGTFSTGKRVTRFSGHFAPLRIVFPCHPYAGGRIKHRETIFS